MGKNDKVIIFHAVRETGMFCLIIWYFMFVENGLLLASVAVVSLFLRNAAQELGIANLLRGQV